MLPPATVMLLTVTFAPPGAEVFEKVTVPVPVRLRTPDGKVIVRGFGETDTVERVVVLVPVNVTGDPVTVVPPA
jgi:hypothetical protein